MENWPPLFESVHDDDVLVASTPVRQAALVKLVALAAPLTAPLAALAVTSIPIGMAKTASLLQPSPSFHLTLQELFALDKLIYMSDDYFPHETTIICLSWV